MYSPEVEDLLRKAGAEPGDRIRLRKGDRTYEGLLMPRSSLGDRGCIVIKLDSGYNIGIAFEEGMVIELLEKGKKLTFESDQGEVISDPSLPLLSILGCGGTIASRVDYRIGAVFPAFSPKDLLISFPELKGEANYRGRKLFDLLSEDMTPEHWRVMAREVESEIREGAQGVVLMHGTDTMHYSSAALSFMLQDLPVPVVLVGAQRSSDRGSSDNAMNLLCSVISAKSDIAEVSVCMHGTTNDDFCLLHRGTKVRKMHTSRRDAFRSINAPSLARIEYSEKRLIHLVSDYRKRDGKRRLRVDDRINPNVALIHIHPGIRPQFISSLSKHYDGVVLAGTGLGHIPTNPYGDKRAKPILKEIKMLIESGIPVVMASQTIYGRVDLNVYAAGVLEKEAGIIGNFCDWTPETAMVKLMWVLGHTNDMTKIKELMEKNVAGEITERSQVVG